MVLVTFIFHYVKDVFSRFFGWKLFVWIVLFLSFALVFFSTVSDRTTGNTLDYNLIPFHSYRAVMNGDNPEILRSNFMNAVLFYPAGLLTASLLPDKLPRLSRLLLTVLLYSFMSAGIEYLQYRYSLGNVEIDDIIHNTLGAFFGSLLGITSFRFPAVFGGSKE